MEFKCSTATCGRTAVISLMIKPHPYDYRNVYACEKCEAAVRSKYSACIVEAKSLPHENLFQKPLPIVNCPRCKVKPQLMNRTPAWSFWVGVADEVLEFYCTNCNHRWEHWVTTRKTEAK